MSLFDAYVAVDWSASAAPNTGADSIWIGVAVRTNGRVHLMRPENPHTRAAAELRVREHLAALVAEHRRILVGFDFPYGYPRGLAAALGTPIGVPAWRATWGRLSPPYSP